MNVDHYFTIGKPHLTDGSPCEDYALSGELRPGLVFGAISDGCGGAFAETDVGARALAYAFKATLAGVAYRDADWLNEAFYDPLLAQFRSNQFTGRMDDYQATLVGLVATPDRAQALILGDGAVAVQYTDGRQVLFEAEWPGNAPLYLVYHQEPHLLDRHREYLAMQGEQFRLNRTERVIKEGMPEITVSRQSYAFDRAARGLVLDFAPATEGIAALAVFSDGIAKVGDHSAVAAMQEFLAFKNYRGGFVKRRMARTLERWAKLGQIPRDDLATACVWFGGDE